MSSRLCLPAQKSFINDFKNWKFVDFHTSIEGLKLWKLPCQQRQLSIVWLQGTVLQVFNEHAEDATFILDDSTGSAIITHFKLVPPGCPMPQKGMYVLVVGEVKEVRPKVTVKAMKIQDLSKDELAQQLWEVELLDQEIFMMFKRFIEKWKQYRYRFVPWLALNLKDRSLLSIPKGKTDKILDNEQVKIELEFFFANLNEELQKCQKGSDFSIIIKRQYGCEDIFKLGLTVMQKHLGFQIETKPSVLIGGGTGVVVTSGTVPKNIVVAMYPGTMYYPTEPVFLQSLGNPFFFRCIDNILIDGNDKGMSKFIYRSCVQRDRVGGYFTSDISWLTKYPVNPMAVGQYVNNHNKEYTPNVVYQEFNVPDDFPFHLRQFLPNVFYSGSSDWNQKRLMRSVVLVSLRDIYQGEELFSSYFTVVHT